MLTLEPVKWQFLSKPIRRRRPPYRLRLDMDFMRRILLILVLKKPINKQRDELFVNDKSTESTLA